MPFPPSVLECTLQELQAVAPAAAAAAARAALVNKNGAVPVHILGENEAWRTSFLAAFDDLLRTSSRRVRVSIVGADDDPMVASVKKKPAAEADPAPAAAAVVFPGAPTEAEHVDVSLALLGDHFRGGGGRGGDGCDDGGGDTPLSAADKDPLAETGLRYFLAQCPIWSFCAGTGTGAAELPELLPLVRTPAAVALLRPPRMDGSDGPYTPADDPVRGLSQINVWASPRTTLSSAHFDSEPNFLAVLRGRKRVALLPPSQSALLRPRLGANHAGEDPVLVPALLAAGGVGRGGASTASPISPVPGLHIVDVAAGSTLFIPEGYWHAVLSEPGTVAVNFWLERGVWSGLVAAAADAPHQSAYTARAALLVAARVRVDEQREERGRAAWAWASGAVPSPLLSPQHPADARNLAHWARSRLPGDWRGVCLLLQALAWRSDGVSGAGPAALLRDVLVELVRGDEAAAAAPSSDNALLLAPVFSDAATLDMLAWAWDRDEVAAVAPKGDGPAAAAAAAAAETDAASAPASGGVWTPSFFEALWAAVAIERPGAAIARAQEGFLKLGADDVLRDVLGDGWGKEA
jgi:hypothetical protein